MSDLVGNPEDRFSHNEAHRITLQKDAERIAKFDSLINLIKFAIEKTVSNGF